MDYTLPPKNGLNHPAIQQLLGFLIKNWFQILIISLGLHLFFNKEISIQFNMNAPEEKAVTTAYFPSEVVKKEPVSVSKMAMPTAFFDRSEPELEEVVADNNKPKTSAKTKQWSSRKANDFSNLSFIYQPESYSDKKAVNKVKKAKIKKNHLYIDRFAPVAVAEMKKFGIPASITLAQGLLESNAGDSRLSVESNNHFGIKCKSKCKGCTCRNYIDDDIYDMFRVFNSAWESYRAHSNLLMGQRYKHLLDLNPLDYKGWAKGLKKAGYATDKKYAEKLIRIIQTFDLDQYDR